MMREEFPAVIDGQLGSLFHGIIQAAYGYSAGFDRVYAFLQSST